MTLLRLSSLFRIRLQTLCIYDTIYDTINNTISGNIFVQQIKEYKDSTYYAKISGINAYLEHIEVYPKTITQYITNTEKSVHTTKEMVYRHTGRYRYHTERIATLFRGWSDKEVGILMNLLRFKLFDIKRQGYDIR